MTASVPWSVSAVDPEAWATARDAARRSGLSVGEWLESAIRESAHEAGRPHRMPVRAVPEAIERRLDDLAERLDHFSRREPAEVPARGARREQAILDSIETLNQRIDALVRDMRGDDRNGPAAVRSAIQRLDDRIEDVISRGQLAQSQASPELERKLEGISRTIESMSRRLEMENARYAAAPVPPSVDVLDAAVAEIMMRQSALDGTPPAREPLRPSPSAPDLSGLERQLKLMADEMQALRSVSVQDGTMDALRRELGMLANKLGELAPRRSLEALEESIESLVRRFDRVSTSRSDETLGDVVEALNEIRSALANVRPAESFASVEKDLQALSRKLDNLNVRGVDSDAVSRLQEQTAEIRELLASALPADGLRDVVEQIEGLVRKFESAAPAADHSIADIMASFERRLEALSQRIESAAHQAPPQSALDDIRARLDELQFALANAGQGSASAIEASLQSLADKVDAAEARLGNLSTIERGLNDLFVQLQEARSSAHDAAERAAKSAVRELASHSSASSELELPRRPLGELDTKYYSAPDAHAQSVPITGAGRAHRDDVDMADVPLEPGSGAPRSRLHAAVEAAGGLAPADNAATDGPSRTSDFIAAARRAAQAAAAEPVAEPSRIRAAGPRKGILASLGRGRRAFLIVLTAFLVIFTALRFFNGNLVTGLLGSKPAPAVKAPSPTQSMLPGPQQPESATPQMQSSAPDSGADTLAMAPPAGMIGDRRDLPFLGEANADPATTGSATTTKSTAAVQTASAPAGATDEGSELPQALGTPALRAAALAGDPVAAYEIGARYLEGRGVQANAAEAAIWLQRAIDKGFAPAAYRLGNLHEKGRGTAKNATEAMRYYAMAADAGNIKAMHNLAVMYSEGPDGKPDYKTAARWFRMAAERGVRDSQYNLGVLYARGLGVDQNLTESFRWFALAANQGDSDAAKKRDDVAKRLDVQTLVAAKLAVQTWNALPVIASANEVHLRPEWEKAETPPRNRSVKK